MIKPIVKLCLILLLYTAPAFSDPGDKNGPYSHWTQEIRAGIPDNGIAGFVGPDGDGKVSDNNYVNPVFVGWATGFQNYLPTPGVDDKWLTPEETLGQVTGHNFDIASLGDMTQEDIDNWLNDAENTPGPGEITLTFKYPIINENGPDFAVFENGFESYSGFGNMIFAELAYVEVSTDGNHFVRFDSYFTATVTPVGGYGTVDGTYVYNLAGKHVNAYNDSWGTPFDLETLSEKEPVVNGIVDINDIQYVRIIDIPGTGDFKDAYGNAIFDGWLTWGSGGYDLEAIGAIHQKTSVCPPIVNTIAANLVTVDSVSLRGSANACGYSTDYHFEYGTTDKYGLVTNGTSLGTENTNVVVSETINGLYEGTMYHYRLVATNEFGTAYGKNETFTTLTEEIPAGSSIETNDPGDDGSCFIKSCSIYEL